MAAMADPPTRPRCHGLILSWQGGERGHGVAFCDELDARVTVAAAQVRCGLRPPLRRGTAVTFSLQDGAAQDVRPCNVEARVKGNKISPAHPAPYPQAGGLAPDCQVQGSRRPGRGGKERPSPPPPPAQQPRVPRTPSVCCAAAVDFPLDRLQGEGTGAAWSEVEAQLAAYRAVTSGAGVSQEDGHAQWLVRDLASARQAAMDEFAKRQLDMQACSLVSNTRKVDAAAAAALIERHQAALQFLLASSTASATAGHATASASSSPGAAEPQVSGWAWLTDALLLEAHRLLVEGVEAAGPGTFRTCGARCGDTHFVEAARVPAAVAELLSACPKLVARVDLSPAAKAAWVAYHLVCIHPFRDGNGRMARLLANVVLHHAGLPFVVSLCSSPEHRWEWVSAIREASSSGGNTRRLAKFICHIVTIAWAEFSRLCTERELLQQDSTEAKIVRVARERTRAGSCVICLDAAPDVMSLCCGGAYHLNCIGRWLRDGDDPRCPTCRSALPRPEPPPRGAHTTVTATTSSSTGTGEAWDGTTTTSDGEGDATTTTMLVAVTYAGFGYADYGTTTTDETTTRS